MATYFLPATAAFEKEGTFVNHAGLVQPFARAIRPPVEVRTESQLGFDLLNRKGLAHIPAVRKELAGRFPNLRSLLTSQRQRRNAFGIGDGLATVIKTRRLTHGLVMPTFNLTYTAIVILGVIAFVLGLVAYLILAERKVAAWVQDRVGPNRVGPGGLLQPIADGGKMFLKEEIIPTHVDRVFFLLAPVVAFATAMLAIAVVPFGSTPPPKNIPPTTPTRPGPRLSRP